MKESIDAAENINISPELKLKDATAQASREELIRSVHRLASQARTLHSEASSRGSSLPSEGSIIGNNNDHYFPGGLDRVDEFCEESLQMSKAYSWNHPSKTITPTPSFEATKATTHRAIESGDDNDTADDAEDNEFEMFYQKRNWESLRRYADRMIQQLNYLEAIQSLSSMDTIDMDFQPTGEEKRQIRRQLALCYLLEGQWQYAEPIINRLAVEMREPVTSELQHAIAIGYFTQSSHDEALRHCKAAMRSKKAMHEKGWLSANDRYDIDCLMSDIHSALNLKAQAVGWTQDIPPNYVYQRHSNATEFIKSKTHVLRTIFGLRFEIGTIPICDDEPEEKDGDQLDEPIVKQLEGESQFNNILSGRSLTDTTPTTSETLQPSDSNEPRNNSSTVQRRATTSGISRALSKSKVELRRFLSVGNNQSFKIPESSSLDKNDDMFSPKTKSRLNNIMKSMPSLRNRRSKSSVKSLDNVDNSLSRSNTSAHWEPERLSLRIATTAATGGDDVSDLDEDGSSSPNAEIMRRVALPNETRTDESVSYNPTVFELEGTGISASEIGKSARSQCHELYGSSDFSLELGTSCPDVGNPAMRNRVEMRSILSPISTMSSRTSTFGSIPGLISDDDDDGDEDSVESPSPVSLSRSETQYSTNCSSLPTPYIGLGGDQPLEGEGWKLSSCLSGPGEIWIPLIKHDDPVPPGNIFNRQPTTGDVGDLTRRSTWNHKPHRSTCPTIIETR